MRLTVDDLNLKKVCLSGRHDWGIFYVEDRGELEEKLNKFGFEKLERLYSIEDVVFVLKQRDVGIAYHLLIDILRFIYYDLNCSISGLDIYISKKHDFPLMILLDNMVVLIPEICEE